MFVIAGLLLATYGSFVSVEQASALLQQGALVLDTRAGSEFHRGHIAGASRIDWKDTRDGWGRTGRLSDDDGSLARKLGDLGVDDRHPVLVVGDSNRGWGEEGRIAWMLEYLGLSDVHVLDGGFQAWRAAARPIETGRGTIAARRSFTPHRNPLMRAELGDVERESRAGGVVILDVRSDKEWNGATPFFEPRGGHIPGARHLEWTHLLDERGAMLPSEVVVGALGGIGITRETPVIVYCTGGVRSAFVWAVLRAAGFHDVRNFDGSFYQWAKQKRLPVERGH
jgi:thiosulfate/3-mercaptopyruvate sulfurtransferase